MSKQRFTVFLLPQEEGGFQAHFPYHPDCFSWGSTVEEALEKAKDSIASHLEGLMDVDADLGLDYVDLPYVTVASIEADISSTVLKRAKREAVAVNARSKQPATEASAQSGSD